jgi:multicomponent Na+:H+ antiporter subunit E
VAFKKRFLLMVINLILRLTIWFLLTADLSLPNILIGVTVSCLLPLNYGHKETLQQWLDVLKKIFITIPQAYLEALEMMFKPHVQEEITQEKVLSNRSPRLIFLDIFMITFTPKTVVLKYDEKGRFLVHWVKSINRQNLIK